VHASKITIIFFLGNKNHGILFLYILVIIYANLSSNAVIFKRIAETLHHQPPCVQLFDTTEQYIFLAKKWIYAVS